MKTNPTVSRFADRETITVQPNTLAKVEEEGDTFTFSIISSGHYACISVDTHVIIDKDGKIGCSCGDMTYRCNGTNVCKHIAAFLNLKVPPQTPAPGELIKKLRLMGWVGGKDDLHPAELLKQSHTTSGSDAKTAPEQTMEHYECPKCGDAIDIEADKLQEWKLKHLDDCTGKKPATEQQKTPPPHDPLHEDEDPEYPEQCLPELPDPPNEDYSNCVNCAQSNSPEQNTKTPLIDNIRKYVGNDVLEVFGDTGSGKSKFALEVAREATAAGLKVFYLDSERNLTDEDVTMLGRGYKYTPVLKEIDDTIRKLPAVDVVIIDSIGFPILTAYARYSMKQKGDALLTMIAMFGDLKQWAYKNNGLVIVVNQPESTFNKEAGHILRPFGDKSQFAAKEIWWLKMVKRADKTTDHHTETLITSFRGRTLGYGDKLYTMNIRTDGIEFIPMR